MDWIEVVRSKQILPKDHLVIYGYSSEQVKEVATLFQKAGYTQLSVYHQFVEEWTGNPELPMEKLERYRQLVPPEWVKPVVDGRVPEEHNGNHVVICHAHYRNRDAYLSGHIPGAIDIDTLALEAPETWNRRSPTELKEALEKHGITADTTVVLYGKFMWPDNEDEFPTDESEWRDSDGDGVGDNADFRPQLDNGVFLLILAVIIIIIACNYLHKM